jgi:hypothetical protein
MNKLRTCDLALSTQVFVCATKKCTLSLTGSKILAAIEDQKIVCAFRAEFLSSRVSHSLIHYVREDSAYLFSTFHLPIARGFACLFIRLSLDNLPFLYTE